MSDLKFGTSGLRGLVSDLTDDICARYMLAFLRHLEQNHSLQKGELILIGQDLRQSSPRIAEAIMRTALSAGFLVENCGALPTPALAYTALSRGIPAVMVTGSHIPEDRNGLKFYRKNGEIDKQDEAAILALLPKTAKAEGACPPIEQRALHAYITRCISLLPFQALKGLRIGVYQHSSVARDIFSDILEPLGATVIPFCRADHFIPVDTEALRDEDIKIARDAAAQYHFDAIVSTDGDADRPLLADQNGQFIKGDLLGILTAEFLKAEAVATPVTSTSIIENAKLFKKVYRCRVGSPYVIDAMNEALHDGYQSVIGFEANGGVLMGSPVMMQGEIIPALPTRDAMLPILSALGLAAQHEVAVADLLQKLPKRFTASGRLQNIAFAQSDAFLQKLKDEKTRNTFFQSQGTIAAWDDIDGVRVTLQNGAVIHYRASGNAPELRCYSEADKREQADQLLAWGLKQFQNEGHNPKGS